MRDMLRTWQTSAAGLGGGALLYITQIGGGLPENRSEWGALGVSAAMAWLGLRAEEPR